VLQVYVFNSAHKDQPGAIFNLNVIDICTDPDSRPYALVENPYCRGETLRATYKGDGHAWLWEVDLD